MKILKLILFSFFLYTSTVKADINECNIEDIGDCSLSLTLKKASDVCGEGKKCYPKLLNDNFEQCIVDIMNYNITEVNDSIKKTYYQNIRAHVGIILFACDKVGDDYCFDQYKNAVDNPEQMSEFTCSECADIVREKIGNLFNKIQTVDDRGNIIDANYYERIKSLLENVGECDKSFAIPISINYFITFINIIFVLFYIS